MGEVYSASVSYGFLIKEDEVPEENVTEYLYSLGIDYAVAADYWSGTEVYIVCCLEDSHIKINFNYQENYKKLNTTDIDIDEVLALQVKLEKAGIPLYDPEPGWYVTTLTS